MKAQTSRYEVFLPIVFLLAVFIFFVFYNSKSKEILIVHSYEPTYSWVRDVNIGLQNTFVKDKRFQVRYLYMDTKRHPEPEFVRNAGLVARRIIGAIQPKVIVCIDDNAQKQVGQFYVNDPKISVVFAGVNADHTKYGYDKAKNITGILERLPLAGLRDTLYILARQRRIPETQYINVAHISDNSETVLSDDAYMHNFNDWGRINLEKSVLVGTFDEWKTAILEANKKLDFVIISNYRSIKRNPQDKEFMPPTEVLKWTVENAKIPMVGVNAFFVEEGGGLAIATSPFEQGTMAANYAQRLVLENEHPSNIPIVKTEQFIVCIRDSVVKKMNINLPDIYEAFARVTKKHYD